MARSSQAPVLRIATIVDGEVCDELHQETPGSVSVGRELGSGVKLYDAWEVPRPRTKWTLIVAALGLALSVAGGWAFALEVEAARAAAAAMEAGIANANGRDGLAGYFGRPESSLPSLGEWGLVLVFVGLCPAIWGAIAWRTGSLHAERPDASAPKAPLRHALFTYRALQGYELDLPDGVGGKISIGSTVATIGDLRRQFAGGADGRVRIRLGRRAKGKLLIGETVILFQLTRPAVTPVHEAFPADLRDPLRPLRMSGLEWAVHLLSFVLLGLPVYYLAVIAEPTQGKVDERYVDLMDLRAVHFQEEKAPEPEPEPEDKPKAPEPKKQPEKERPPEVEPEPSKRPEKFSKKARAKAQSVGLAKALANFGVAGDASIVDRLTVGALQHSDFAAEGMGVRGNGLVGAGEGDFIVGGEQIDVDGAVVGNEGLGTSDGPAGIGQAKKREKKIVSRVSATNTEVFGDVDAKRIRATIRRRTGALQHCYDKALRVKPNISGRLSYSITVSVRGRVTEVRIEGDTLKDPSVRACTIAKIKGWRFSSKGAEESADVSFSVVFEK